MSTAARPGRSLARAVALTVAALFAVAHAAHAEPPPAALELKPYLSLPKLHAAKERVWPARQLAPGKAVVVSFMASWCEPCIAELPELEALAQEPGVEVWLIVLADDRPEGGGECRLPSRIAELLPPSHGLADHALVDRCAGAYEKLTGSAVADLPLTVVYGASPRPLRVQRGRPAGKTLGEAFSDELERARRTPARR
jgi:thiol-disulfide isomerase/thioredoxin